jgi:hypothetical protein
MVKKIILQTVFETSSAVLESDDWIARYCSIVVGINQESLFPDRWANAQVFFLFMMS